MSSYDDFARRLSEFVSNAGNTLYKGISEILDRALSDRRDKGSQVESLRQATGDQIAQVVAARAALRILREGIWAPPQLDSKPADE